MQSRETQITMVKWTNAGGQTKWANERSFYRPPAWKPPKEVILCEVLFQLFQSDHDFCAFLVDYQCYCRLGH